MSGHSRWANIKRHKSAVDARRAKVFTKILREVTVAAREGGLDPAGNPRLRLAIANAKGANLSKETLERAIHKATDRDASQMTRTSYEGYAPGGVAVYVECLTDNINRTVSNIRAAFSKFGGNMVKNGSLAHLFVKKGVFAIPTRNLSIGEEAFTLEVIDGGAEDVAREDEAYIIYTHFEEFGSMQKKLEAMEVVPESSLVQLIPSSTSRIDPESAGKVLKLIDAFEEDDDVQNVYHNMDITEEMLTENG